MRIAGDVSLRPRGALRLAASSHPATSRSTSSGAWRHWPPLILRLKRRRLLDPLELRKHVGVLRREILRDPRVLEKLLHVASRNGQVHDIAPVRVIDEKDVALERRVSDSSDVFALPSPPRPAPENGARSREAA